MSNGAQYGTKKWLMLVGLQFLAIVFAHAQFNPTDIGGLQLWLRADSGVVFNGAFVSHWTDLSGNSRHATSSLDVIRPTRTSDAINGLPAITFDGAEDFLEFTEISDVRTVFWIIREHPSATSVVSRPLLGWSGGLNFLRGDNQFIFNGQYSAPQVHNGITKLNGTIVNSASTLLNPGFNMVSLSTTGNVQASHLTMESNTFGRTWWGDMAEVLIYNTPLSEEEMADVEQYLFNRYAPVYTAMPDVQMENSLCDTALCIPPAFQNVIWNETVLGSCFTADSSGTYTVEFNDVFGRSYRDTVDVQYAIDNGSLEETFCTGEYYNWPNTESTFGLTWNGVSVEAVQSDQVGVNTLLVTDNAGCSKTILINLSEDLFANNYAISTQDIYCSGAVLQIIPPLPLTASSIWNGQLTQDNWTLTESGTYTVESTNNNGCVMRDTVDVTLAGASSILQLSADGACVGTAVEMMPLIQTGEPIISGIWHFGDESTATSLAVSHTYSEPGSYEVEYTGTNSIGCESYASMEVIVHALPIIGFESSGQCTNAPIELHAIGSSLDGVISSFDWLVDGQFLQGENVSVMMSLPGFNNVIVAATTEYGCTAEWSQLYQVFSPPSTDAQVSEVCHGALTQCQWQLVQSGNNQTDVNVAWDFGDGTGSLQQQPFHFYTYPGVYEIELTTTNTSGCVDTTLLTATVYASPEADFLITNFCEMETKELIDMSVASDGDPIVNWLWNIDGSSELTGQQPMVSFDGQGLHPVMLTVESEHGCVGEVLQQVPVWPTPVVSFSWDPILSGAPWNVPLQANANMNVDFSWYFGDGSNGQGAAVEHLYGMNGTYNIQLTGTTPQGCSQTTSQILTVADPVLDVAVVGLQITPSSDGSTIQVQLRNNGNLKLEEIMMSWQLGGNAPVIENWQLGLAPGETGVYQFSSRVTDAGAVYPYICVNAETSPWLTIEQNLTDNAYCKPLESGGLELFSPYPNPGDDRMFVRLIAPLDGVINMSVLDNKGQQVMRYEELEVDKGFQQFFIDISSLTNGTYKMVAEMEGAKSVVSFMKIAR